MDACGPLVSANARPIANLKVVLSIMKRPIYSPLNRQLAMDSIERMNVETAH